MNWDKVDRETDRWLIAVKEAEWQSDLQPVVELLRSEAPLTPSARELLADLFQRHQLKKSPGGQQVPIWAMSEAEAHLVEAAEDYKQFRQVGASEDDALKRAAHDWECTVDTLRNYLAGKRGASRRRRA